MPEGPEIRRAADSIEAAICGKEITGVEFTLPHSSGGNSCYRCGTRIIRQNSGGQACYLCPQCQPEMR